MSIFHTLSLYYPVNKKQYQEIREHLYQNCTSGIYPTSKPKSFTTTLTTHEYKEYGISSLILTETNSPTTYYNAVKLERFNPTKLLGKENHCDLTEQADIQEIDTRFTQLVKSIHPVLPKLGEWKTYRIDYSANIITENVPLYIELFQRSDKPTKRYEELRSATGKQEQLDNSFYLSTKSFSLNFYNKQGEVINKGQDQKHIDDAEDVLRVEVQCNKAKINSIKHKDANITSTELDHFITPDLAREVLLSYYDQTIGSGDYYTLDGARNIINAQSDITDSMKDKLINHLKDSNDYKFKNLWEAKQAFGNNRLFNSYMKQIRALNINPVTIRKRAGLSFLPNLREALVRAIDPRMLENTPQNDSI